LLDNNVNRRFARLLPDYDVTHVQQLDWANLKNGLLLNAAESAGYDVLVTVDKQMQYQQNMGNRRISVIVLNSLRIVLEEITPLAPKVLALLPDLPKGALVLVSPGQTK
jgi:hypothetical protein